MHFDTVAVARAECSVYSGHGKSLKSTGPPRPASASKRLMMTAIAASSLLGLLDPWSLSIISMPMWGFSPVEGRRLVSKKYQNHTYIWKATSQHTIELFNKSEGLYGESIAITYCCYCFSKRKN